MQEATAILDVAEFGVLSTIGNDGQPYGVPLNYIYKDRAIYFHCAVAGQKLDNIVNGTWLLCRYLKNIALIFRKRHGVY